MFTNELFNRSSFWDYGEWARSEIIAPRKMKYASLLEEDKLLVPWFEEHLLLLESCIDKNEQFFQTVVSTVAQQWVPSRYLVNKQLWTESNVEGFERVKSMLGQVNREWAASTKNERDVGFQRILRVLNNEREKKEDTVNVNVDGNGNDIYEVLVPGVGLSRITLELIQRGFKCQGNEFSYFMLILSNFLLNYCDKPNEIEIFPFIHQFSNQISRQNQLRRVLIPDISALDVLKSIKKKSLNDNDNNDNQSNNDLMSIFSGSFVDLYGPNNGIKDSSLYDKFKKDSIEFRELNENKFDAIVTMFFIDTSTNVIEYLKAIEHSLKKNGVWINFGHLLWHYDNNSASSSSNNEENSMVISVGEGGRKLVVVPLKGLEMTRDDVVELVKSVGFEFKEYENNVETTYGNDGVDSERRLAEWLYRCEFWVCNKRE